MSRRESLLYWCGLVMQLVADGCAIAGIWWAAVPLSVAAATLVILSIWSWLVEQWKMYYDFQVAKAIERRK